jgi:hypothetical protein
MPLTVPHDPKYTVPWGEVFVGYLNMMYSARAIFIQCDHWQSINKLDQEMYSKNTIVEASSFYNGVRDML